MNLPLNLIFWIYSIIWLAPRHLWADNCCGDSCDDSCPWNGACNSGRDYSCMDGISGSFKCRDKSACTNVDCSDRDIAYRTGQLCRGFPWFNGGFPFDNIKADSEIKTSDCVNASTNGLYCKNWRTMENSLDEFKIVDSSCLSPSDDNKYCKEWSSLGTEYKKCWIVVPTNNNENNNNEPPITQCCNKDTAHLPCCQSLCSVSYYTFPQVQYDRIQCSCKQVSSNGEFCAQWYCEDQTIFDSSALTSDQPIEYEWYTCRKTSSNALYCPSWDGDIDSVEEFEVTSCSCLAEADGGHFCRRWQCFEKGYDYWWPNMLWAIFSVLLGGLPYLLLCIEFSIFFNVFFWLGFFVWSGGFIVIGVWKAGVAVAVITVVVLYGPVVIYLMYCAIRAAASSPSLSLSWPAFSSAGSAPRATRYNIVEVFEEAPAQAQARVKTSEEIQEIEAVAIAL